MSEPIVDRYLTVMGVVSDSGEVELFPSFVSPSDLRVATDERSPYVVEMVGSDGVVLKRHRIPFGELCYDGSTTQTIVMGKVPYPDGTRAMRILEENQVVLERAASDRPPELRLTWDASQRVDNWVTVSWEAQHPEGLPLHFLVAFDHTGEDNWRPVAFVTSDLSVRVDMAHLPGGRRCRLAVLASDDFHTVQAVTDPFEVPLRPCQAIIQSPLDGDQLAPGQAVMMTGHGHWLEEDRIERKLLKWSSTLQGELGTGPSLTKTLQSGVHDITLRAGSADRSSIDSVTITVGDPGHPA